jgi:hypothetical protein
LGTSCRGICHYLKGYRKGFCRYAANGNKACITCIYQVPTIMRKCPCCKQVYRMKPHTPKKYYNNNNNNNNNKILLKVKTTTKSIIS